MNLRTDDLPIQSTDIIKFESSCPRRVQSKSAFTEMYIHILLNIAKIKFYIT